MVATDGCTVNKDTLDINVIVHDSLELSTTADDTICFGRSYFLRAFSSGGPESGYTYTWNNGLGSNASYIVSPDEPTTYIVKLSDGCSEYEPIDSVLLYVHPKVVADIIGPDTLCYQNEATYYAVTSGGRPGPLTHTWGNGNSADSIKLTFNKDTSLILTATDGCSSVQGAATLEVTVRQPLSVSLNNDTSVCSGENLMIIAVPSGGDPTKYQLSWSDPSISDDTRQWVKTASLSEQIRVDISDDCSEPDFALFNLQVYESPEVSFSAIEFPTCVGYEVQFVNQSKFPSNCEFEWNFGNGETSNLEEPIQVYEMAGSYDISLKITTPYDCIDRETKTEYAQVYELPEAKFSFSPEDPSFFRNEVYFTNHSNDATDYTWEFPDDTRFETNPVYTFQDAGKFEITLIASNDGVCKDTAVQIIEVDDEFVIHIPNAFSPYRVDDINDTYKPYAHGFSEYEFVVFNRWGEIMFTHYRSG